MSVIKQLPQELISKIAAGEVILRPASVVKELVENSLDAGATKIDIHLEDAGISRLIVADNGSGMNRKDLLQCFLPHTTSKLINTGDLYKIDSLGFRGEALSSIATVSLLRVQSRHHNEDVGTTITVRHEQLQSQRPMGMQAGTRVVVEELFAHFPARRKFLNSVRKELQYSVYAVATTAIAHHKTAFSLTHNGKRIMALSQVDSLKARIVQVLGDTVSGELLEIEHQTEYGTIRGFIGTPQTQVSNTSGQYIFVNNRPVTNSNISRIIKRAYGTLIDPRMHPTFVLFLDVPKETVDVNIHPQKETVHLLHEEALTTHIDVLVKRTLDDHDLTYEKRSLEERGMDRHTADVLREVVNIWQVRGTGSETQEIIQVHDCYLITQTKKGLLLVDQHAAHERILYEQFLEAFKENSASLPTITLKQPIVFEVPRTDAILLEDNIETFSKLGFDIEPFGNGAFKVSKVPTLFAQRNISGFISEVLNDVVNNNGHILDNVTHKTLAFLACRSAIKSGDRLNMEERKRLIRKLSITSTQYTCPHGRPVHLTISLSELEKMFKRK